MKRASIIKLSLVLSLLIFDILILKIWKVGLAHERYEISIYQNIKAELGLIVFLIIILPLILGLFFNELSKIIRISSILLPSFGIIFFYSLPMLKNYFTYGTADPLGHTHAIAYIIKYGSLSPISSKYPISHILGAIFYIVSVPRYSTFEISRMEYILPIIHDVLFILFNVLILMYIFKSKIHPLLFILLIIPFFSYYHVTIYPHAFSLMLLPMFAYLYWNFLRSYEVRWFVISTVIVTYFVFSHPVPIVGLIAGLVLTYPTVQLVKLKNGGIFKALPLIYPVMLVARLISDENILREGPVLVINYLFNPYTHLPRQKDLLIELKLPLNYKILILLKMYGSILALDILCLVIILKILIKTSKKEIENFELLSLISITVGMISIHLLGFFGTQRITYGRLLGLNFGFWALPLFLYIYSEDKLSPISKKGSKLALYSAVIILVLILGMLSVYRSPWLYQSNWERTEKLTIGEFWFLSKLPIKHREERVRYAIAPMGTRFTFYNPLIFPEHFGFYSELPPDRYIAEHGYKYGYILLSDVFKETVKLYKLPYNLIPSNYFYPGITMEDLKKLRVYNKILKIYDNSDLEVFYILGE